MIPALLNAPKYSEIRYSATCFFPEMVVSCCPTIARYSISRERSLRKEDGKEVVTTAIVVSFPFVICIDYWIWGEHNRHIKMLSMKTNSVPWKFNRGVCSAGNIFALWKHTWRSRDPMWINLLKYFGLPFTSSSEDRNCVLELWAGKVVQARWQNNAEQAVNVTLFIDSTVLSLTIL